MSGRSIGLVSCHFSGVRVTSQLTYIPAYISKSGKQVNAKVTIPVAKNSHKGTTVKPDGTVVDGRTDYFTLTAWGKLADILARSCPVGKALDALCEPRSYMGKLFNQDGSLRLDNAGQPIEIPKISFNMIVAPVFGEESKGQIDKEIANGLRPANWDVKGHPDFEMWTNMLKQRQAYCWDGSSPTFLFARVVVPQGVQLDFSRQANATATAPAAGSTIPYVAPQATVPSMVAHAVNTQVPVQPVQQVAPVAPQFTPGANINQVI